MRARQSLLAYQSYTNPKFRPHWYHKVIAETLEEFVQHRIQNLIIVLPPRHGKTEAASRSLPAWIMGQAPDKQIISAANAQQLADRNSRDVRKRLVDPRHIAAFGDCPLAKSTDAEWQTEAGGIYRAVGVGGGIAGYGADYIIVDDYVLNRSQIESPTERDKQWQWFQDDILTRRHYPASVLLMATRWHPDDIIGRVLSPDYGTGEPWTVLHLPKMLEGVPGWRDQRTESGEMLLSPFAMAPWEYLPGQPEPTVDPFLKRDPVLVSYEEIQERERSAFLARREKNPYGVDALEQGNPVPKGGGLVQDSWIKYYTATPHDVAEGADKIVISIDAAFKDNPGSDNCSILVLAKKGHLLFVIDEDTDRMAWTKLKARTKAMFEKYPTATILIEDKANGTALIDELRSECPRVSAFDPGKFGNKATRAHFAAERYESGSILHPSPLHAPWVKSFEVEVCSFPYAPHDDRVDALSQAVLFLDRKRGGLDALNKTIASLSSRFGLS